MKKKLLLALAGVIIVSGVFFAFTGKDNTIKHRDFFPDSGLWLAKAVSESVA